MRLKPRRRVVLPPKPEAATAPPTLPLEEAWAEASRLYSNRAGMRVRRSWGWGVGERVGAARFGKLTGGAAAKRVTHLLGLLSVADLRVFLARAAVSFEQAAAATRLTLVVNVSAPVGILLLLDTVFEGGIAALFGGGPIGAFVLAAVLAAVGVVLFLVVWYAYAGVHQMRDLHHLALLEAARRGLAPIPATGDQNLNEASP